MELRTNSYKMSARMRSNTSIGKPSAGPLWGFELVPCETPSMGGRGGAPNLEALNASGRV
jgi:hypothetical protein